MSQINFAQSFKINLRLFWAAVWLITKMLVVGIGLFVIITGGANLIWESLFNVNLFGEDNIWTYPYPKFLQITYSLGINIIIYFFYRRPFNHSLRRKYKHFQLNFDVNHPNLKFYFINCFLNYFVYISVNTIVNHFIFGYPLSELCLSLIGLEEGSLWEGNLVTLPINFLAAIFILQWQLNRNTDKFKLTTF